MGNLNILAKEKGARLQEAREKVRFDRKEAAQIAEVSSHTYKGWEVGKYGGLPEHRAKKLLTAFQAEGLQCTLEWIMHGIGESPIKITGYLAKKLEAAERLQIRENLSFNILTKADEEAQIKRELDLFCKSLRTPLYVTIDDMAMAPLYLPGDTLAGNIVPKREYKNLIGKPCLIETQNGRIILRQLQQGAQPNLYTLVCLNAETNLPFSENDVEIANAAQILWHRRNRYQMR